jgi:hypothetical protein
MREFKDSVTGHSKDETTVAELPPPADVTPTPDDPAVTPEQRKTEHVS